MPLCSKKLAEDYFKAYGWNYKSLDCGAIISGWSGRDGQQFCLRLESYENWYSIQVNPFRELRIDWERWPEVGRFLLEFNDSSHLAKISLDVNGGIQIGIDLFIKNLNYPIFEEALSVLAHYSEDFHQKLLNYLDDIGYSYCDSLSIIT